MSAKEEKYDPSEEEFADFVPAAFARSVEEAEVYRELLNDHDIPAIVGLDEDLKAEDAPKGRRRGMTHGVPVLVPEALLDEASEVIADREDADEFAEEDEVEEEEEEEFEELKPLTPDGEPVADEEDEEEEEDLFASDEEDEEDLLEEEEEEEAEEEEDDLGEDEEEEEESADGEE